MKRCIIRYHRKIHGITVPEWSDVYTQTKEYVDSDSILNLRKGNIKAFDSILSYSHWKFSNNTKVVGIN